MVERMAVVVEGKEVYVFCSGYYVGRVRGENVKINHWKFGIVIALCTPQGSALFPVDVVHYMPPGTTFNEVADFVMKYYMEEDVEVEE